MSLFTVEARWIESSDLQQIDERETQEAINQIQDPGIRNAMQEAFVRPGELVAIATNFTNYDAIEISGKLNALGFECIIQESIGDAGLEPTTETGLEAVSCFSDDIERIKNLIFPISKPSEMDFPGGYNFDLDDLTEKWKREYWKFLSDSSSWLKEREKQNVLRRAFLGSEGKIVDESSMLLFEDRCYRVVARWVGSEELEEIRILKDSGHDSELAAIIKKTVENDGAWTHQISKVTILEAHKIVDRLTQSGFECNWSIIPGYENYTNIDSGIYFIAEKIIENDLKVRVLSNSDGVRWTYVWNEHNEERDVPDWLPIDFSSLGYFLKYIIRNKKCDYIIVDPVDLNMPDFSAIPRDKLLLLRDATAVITCGVDDNFNKMLSVLEEEYDLTASGEMENYFNKYNDLPLWDIIEIFTSDQENEAKKSRNS